MSEERTERGSGPELGLVGAERQRLRALVESRMFGTQSDPVRIGRYTVLKRLGSGGMGIVYTAFDPQLDRQVALKLLRPDAFASDGSSGRARLVREAQAMAKLAHPNVVHVYDTGTHGDQVYVVMELVTGRTLASWMEEEHRGWRAVLSRFIQAGRGLAAAHAAGLIHRDFKPDNVLIGDDGRVRVGDFGIARAEHLSAPSTPPRPATPPPDPPAPGPALVDTPMTRAGTVMGTPAYMSPEQLRSDGASSRSDQFSFCVALYEALFDEHPFGGSNRKALQRRVLAGSVRTPRLKRRAPAWLLRAITRGLSVEPDDRHASMDALLAELERGMAGRKWRLLLGGSGVAMGLAAFAVALRPEPEIGPCDGLDSRLAEVWNDARRQRIGNVFAISKRTHAVGTWERVRGSVEQYAGAWLGQVQAACEATHLRGEQSEQLLHLRMACLERRREQLVALMDLLEGADDDVVDGAVQATERLPPLEPCANADVLLARADGDDPSGERGPAADIRATLNRAQVLHAAGKYGDALEQSRRALGEARSVAHRELEARSLHLTGWLEDRTGQSASAEDTLRTAMVAARAAGDAELEATVLIHLCWVVGYSLQRLDEIEPLQALAEATIESMGGDDRLRATLLSTVGSAIDRGGRHREAIAILRRALDLRRRVFSEDSSEVATSLSNLATALTSLERFDEAAPLLRQSLAVRERLYGSNHPYMANSLDNMGNVLSGLGRTEESLKFHRRALELRSSSLGERHPDVGSSYNNMGEAYSRAGQHDDAVRHYREALAIWRENWGDQHAMVGIAEANIGVSLWDAGEHRQAVPHLERGLAIVEVRLPSQEALQAKLQALLTEAENE